MMSYILKAEERHPFWIDAPLLTVMKSSSVTVNTSE